MIITSRIGSHTTREGVVSHEINNMPHLVYSSEEIESCLYWVRLSDTKRQNGPNDNSLCCATYSCWWPCLIVESMSMLHGICKQKNYMQDYDSLSTRMEAFLHRCRVDKGATSKKVALLLGSTLPSSVPQYWFEGDHTMPWTICKFRDHSLFELTTFPSLQYHRIAANEEEEDKLEGNPLLNLAVDETIYFFATKQRARTGKNDHTDTFHRRNEGDNRRCAVAVIPPN